MCSHCAYVFVYFTFFFAKISEKRHKFGRSRTLALMSYRHLQTNMDEEMHERCMDVGELIHTVIDADGSQQPLPGNVFCCVAGYWEPILR